MQQEDGNHVSLRVGGQETPHDSPSFCLLKGLTEGPDSDRSPRSRGRCGARPETERGRNGENKAAAGAGTREKCGRGVPAWEVRVQGLHTG